LSEREDIAALAQLDLFNEAETFGDQPDSEVPATGIAVPAHTRERGKSKRIDATLPRVRIEHDIPDDQKTGPCGCRDHARRNFVEAVKAQLP